MSFYKKIFLILLYNKITNNFLITRHKFPLKTLTIFKKLCKIQIQNEWRVIMNTNSANTEDFSKSQRIETMLNFINSMISMGVECNNIIIYDYETGCVLHDIWHEIPYSEYMHDMALKTGYAFPDYYVVECDYNKVSKNFKIYVRG